MSQYPSQGQAPNERDEPKSEPVNVSTYQVPLQSPSSLGPTSYTVGNGGSTQSEMHAAAVRAVSPPLPPGAAKPRLQQSPELPISSPIHRWNTVTSTTGRQQTPPPVYSPPKN